MAPALKRSSQKNINHFLCLGSGYKAGRDTDNVGIIMFAGQFCKVALPAYGSPYILMFIGCNSNTIATTTNQDSASRLTVLYSFSYGMRKIRIIDRIGAVSAKVFYFQAFILKKINNDSLVFITCMVTTYRYGL